MQTSKLTRRIVCVAYMGIMCTHIVPLAVSHTIHFIRYLTFAAPFTPFTPARV